MKRENGEPRNERRGNGEAHITLGRERDFRESQKYRWMGGWYTRSLWDRREEPKEPLVFACTWPTVTTKCVPLRFLNMQVFQRDFEKCILLNTWRLFFRYFR